MWPTDRTIRDDSAWTSCPSSRSRNIRLASKWCWHACQMWTILLSSRTCSGRITRTTPFSRRSEWPSLRDIFDSFDPNPSRYLPIYSTYKGGLLYADTGDDESPFTEFRLIYSIPGNGHCQFCVHLPDVHKLIWELNCDFACRLRQCKIHNVFALWALVTCWPVSFCPPFRSSLQYLWGWLPIERLFLIFLSCSW